MKKIGLICMALVMALGLLGVAFATWTDVLTIAGTVNTGTVAVEFSEGVSWDNEEKDVSSITCVLTNPKTITVTVLNAYPSIDYYNSFDIHGLGTVPVDITAVDVDMTNVPTGATVEVLGVATQPVAGQPLPALSPLLGQQLHASDRVWGVIHVHIDNAVAQSSSFTFTVTITATQYNMAP